LNLTIPANTTAQVYLPTRDVGFITEGDKPASQAEGVKFLRNENGDSVFEVGAGEYKFAVPYGK
jgi:alpha-L-rhamnosidase